VWHRPKRKLPEFSAWRQPRVTTSIQWSSPLLAVLSYGFRPFFLLGAAFAAFAIPLWLIMLVHGVAPMGPFQGIRWHAHEMIFGFLAAINYDSGGNRRERR
jgi:uncharacterized protein involved in response to NO